MIGIPDHPSHIRPLAYALLLGTLPADKKSWKSTASKQRSKYYVRVPDRQQTRRHYRRFPSLTLGFQDLVRAFMDEIDIAPPVRTTEPFLAPHRFLGTKTNQPPPLASPLAADTRYYSPRNHTLPTTRSHCASQRTLIVSTSPCCADVRLLRAPLPLPRPVRPRVRPPRRLTGETMTAPNMARARTAPPRAETAHERGCRQSRRVAPSSTASTP